MHDEQGRRKGEIPGNLKMENKQEDRVSQPTASPSPTLPLPFLRRANPFLPFTFVALQEAVPVEEGCDRSRRFFFVSC